MCWSHLSLYRQIWLLVSVAGCLGYDVLGQVLQCVSSCFGVSVAGCLGYDVLVITRILIIKTLKVSVAGCLGYDVLA